MQVPNCPAFYDLWFATALSGLVLVPTSPQSSADELAHVYADAEPAVSVVEAAHVQRAVTQAEACSAAVHVIDIDGVVALAEDSGLTQLAPSPVDRPAAILYTSGTTSRAKGVVVTGANYGVVGHAVAEHLRIREHDRWLVTLPLFHANAQYYCTMSALSAGASVALTPRFSASGWGTQARESGATLASLFAAPIRMILEAPPDRRDSDNQLRTVIYAQNVSVAEASAFESRFWCRLVQLYGMTETVLPSTVNPDDDTRRWDSMGRPLAGTELRVQPDDSETAAAAGELWVKGRRGHTIADGYWRNPIATDEVFVDGWLHTGDLVRFDADGFYYFVDRAKDIIKRSGENVSAAEVERIANDHPCVMDSAAIGVPDPIKDQAIVLAVVARPGSGLTAVRVLRWCEQRMAPYKVPSAVVFIDQLPRTSVGKIRKADLRATLGDPIAYGSTAGSQARVKGARHGR